MRLYFCTGENGQTNKCRKLVNDKEIPFLFIIINFIIIYLEGRGLDLAALRKRRGMYLV